MFVVISWRYLITAFFRLLLTTLPAGVKSELPCHCASKLDDVFRPTWEQKPFELQTKRFIHMFTSYELSRYKSLILPLMPHISCVDRAICTSEYMRQPKTLTRHAPTAHGSYRWTLPTGFINTVRITMRKNWTENFLTPVSLVASPKSSS